MKKSNKVIAVVLSLVLLLTAVGGTLAWLTDRDSKENVFSVGSVEIRLDEISEVNNGKTGDDKVVYTDKTVVLPTGTNYKNLMPGNKIVKTPTITNIGTNDAYVRVVVEVENKGELVTIMDEAIDQIFEEKIGKNTTEYNNFYNTIFDGWGISYLKTQETGNMMRFTMNQRSTDSQVMWIDSVRVMEDDTWQFNNANEFMSDYESGNATNNDANFHGIGYYNFDGDSYYGDLMTQGEGKLIYVFYLELKPEESYTLFNGLNVPEEFDAESLAFFNDLEINVYADAIQTEGFAAWQDAINALNAAHPLNEWKAD